MVVLHTVPVGTIPCVLLLVVALVISTQIMMLMERHRAIDRRLRDLGMGGDAFSLLAIGMLTMGSAGAVVGSIVKAAGVGGAVGLALSLAVWTGAVLWAHRQPQPPARH